MRRRFASAFIPALPRTGRRALVLSGLAGLTVAILLTLLQQGPSGTPVLVARERIPAGTLLDAATLESAVTLTSVTSDRPLAGLLDDPARIVDRRTAVAVAPGEPLTGAVLGGATPAVAPLAPGERAVSIPLSAAGSAAVALQPGVRVDVVASTGEGAAGRTRVVVSAAEVLAVDGGVGDTGLGDPAASGSVVLRAGARDALLITAALNFARDVRVLARPAEEGPATSLPEVAAP